MSLRVGGDSNGDDGTLGFAERGDCMTALVDLYSAEPGTDAYEYLRRLDMPLPEELLDYLLAPQQADGEFVRTVQKAQGLPISIVEEIAYENGWITREELMESVQRYGKSPYGQHLKDIVDGRIKLVQNQND